MAKTIRDTILAYPGLADCEDFWITSFCRDAVLKVQKIVRRSISKTKAGGRRPLFHGRRSAGLHGKQALHHVSPCMV